MSDIHGTRPGEQLPISAHPAFPAIVALWFAALLGLGSLVLPIALFEGIAVSSGLSAFLGAAQPPLGVTARIAVAATAAAFGAGAGLMIARKIIAASVPKPAARSAAPLRSPDKEAPPFAKRPISAHEELGADGIDAEPEEPARPNIPGRRRALNVTEEGARSDFLDFAPLPGQKPGEPLDLVEFIEPAAERTAEPAAEPEPEPAPEPEPNRATALPFGTASLSARMPFKPQEFAMSQPAPTPMPFAHPAEPRVLHAPEPAAAPVGDRALGELGMVELVERFALALQRRQHMQAAAAEAEAEAEAEPAPLVFPPATATVPRTEAAPPPTIPAALRPIDFDQDEPADDDHAAVAGLDLSAAFQSQPRPFAAPAPQLFAALSEAQADDNGDDIAEEGYTSLLAMKSPFSAPRESVRIEDECEDDGAVEPLVVFPGHGAHASPAADGPARDAAAPFGAQTTFRPFDRAPTGLPETGAAAHSAASRTADPAATERALREALEKLQKLSGAA